MLPAVAVTVPAMLTDPLNNADDAVTLPLALTLKFDAEIKKLSPVADPDIKKFVPVKASPLNVKPPILPPLNNTLDPVICPLLLSTNWLLEDDIAAGVRPKPAISFTVPKLTTLLFDE